MVNWRKYAEELNATEGTGPWKRRVAVALGKVEGTGPWARRIVDGKSDGKSWDRAAENALKDEISSQ